MSDEEEIAFDSSNDFLKFKNNPEIKKIIDKEQLLFSDKIYKKNSYGLTQERYIVITNNAIYNLKGKQLKRKIEISKLKGITNSSKTNEFVLHGNEEYDYLYYSYNKNIIIYIIEKIYEHLMGKNLLFANLEVDNLKNKVTSKKEKEKNPNFSRMDDSQLTDITEYLKKNYLTEDDLFNEFDYDNNNEPNVYDSYQPRETSKNIEITDNFFISDEYYDLPKCNFEDFEFLKIIGKGKFSITYLGKRKNQNYFCAIKATDKISLIENEAIDNLITEKRILTSINILSSNNMITKKLFCFQTIDKIFFVYPFYKSGDLYTYVEKNGGKLNENQIKFIICEIVIIFLKLHENNIIYRNLKKENILIDDKGHIKLVDFSKSKILLFEDDVATSFIETPEHMALEIILGKGQKFSVDWYMLGVLIYELYYGYSPFNDIYIDRIFNKIINSCINFNDDSINNNIKELILDLMEFEPEKRLGDYGIKSHHFFEGIKWEEFEFCLKESPIIPNVSDKPDDLQNFDQEFLNEEISFDNYIDGFTLEKIKSAKEKGLFNFFDN